MNGHGGAVPQQMTIGQDRDCMLNFRHATVSRTMEQPRRIPPWRRRDAAPGPLVVVILISMSIMALLATIILFR